MYSTSILYYLADPYSIMLVNPYFIIWLTLIGPSGEPVTIVRVAAKGTLEEAIIKRGGGSITQLQGVPLQGLPLPGCSLPDGSGSATTSTPTSTFSILTSAPPLNKEQRQHILASETTAHSLSSAQPIPSTTITSSTTSTTSSSGSSLAGPPIVKEEPTLSTHAQSQGLEPGHSGGGPNDPPPPPLYPPTDTHPPLQQHQNTEDGTNMNENHHADETLRQQGDHWRRGLLACVDMSERGFQNGWYAHRQMGLVYGTIAPRFVGICVRGKGFGRRGGGRYQQGSQQLTDGADNRLSQSNNHPSTGSNNTHKASSKTNNIGGASSEIGTGVGVGVGGRVLSFPSTHPTTTLSNVSGQEIIHGEMGVHPSDDGNTLANKKPRKNGPNKVLKTPYQPSLSMHPINPPSQHTL